MGPWVKAGNPYQRLLKNSGKIIRSLKLGESSGGDGNSWILDEMKVKIKGYLLMHWMGGLKESKELKTTLRVGS